MIRVLQIMSSTNKGSGITNVIMNYFRNIDRSEIIFDFLVFGNAPENYNDEIRALGGEVYYFAKPSIKSYLIAPEDLTEFFEKHREYDIIHCNEILVSNIVFKIARRFSDVVCLSHSHSMTLSGNRLKAFRNKVLIINLKFISDYCLACSDKAAVTAYGSNILIESKYKYIPNAIDTSKYHYSEANRIKIRKEFNISENEFVIGHVGRFSIEKNHRFILNFFSKFLSQGYSGKLILIGNGSLKVEMQSYCKILGIGEHVIFTDNRSDVNVCLSSMDVFVLPSFIEGLPLSVIEAQINGMPILCSNRISTMVKISDGLEFLSIDNNVEWVQKLISIFQTKQRFNADINAFEISVHALKLQQFYQSIVKIDRHEN